MDSYRTIKALSEGAYSEKRSKFLAFAMPVRSVEEVKQFVAEYQREPLELFTKEHQLALWLQQQKDCWHKGLLSPEEEQNLINLLLEIID